METKDPEDEALAAITSACYQQEAAAERYLAAVQRWISGYLAEELAAMDAEQLDDCDACDLAHEIVDGIDAVIYTHRARAIVLGYGEEEARHEYAREIGAEATELGWDCLAYFVLHEYACQEAGEERARLMCLAEIEEAEEVEA